MQFTEKQEENGNPLLSNRELRDEYIGRYEVLDQVKKLLLLPDNKTATVKQIAEYYSTIRSESEKALGMKDIIISEDAIQKIYQRNKEEFSYDGVIVKKAKDFLGWTPSGCSAGDVRYVSDGGGVGYCWCSCDFGVRPFFILRS